MDHLLSMEKVEKKNLRNLGDSTKVKSSKKRLFIQEKDFYLVLRDYFSQILFFEN